MAFSLLWALPLVPHAADLATINPCPDCPSQVSHAPITVTKQFQVVSTCSASTTMVSSTLYRNYPCESSTWVSTVIPTVSNGQLGNTTVTKTDQKVTFSAQSWVETVTSTKTEHPTLRRRFEAPRFALRAANASTGAAALPGVITSPTVVTETAFRTHELYNCAAFNSMGPIAMPGRWQGSGLLTNAGPDEHGALTQTVDVTSCLDHACTSTAQTWIQEPVTTVAQGMTTTITITRTVGVEAAPTGSSCSAFRLKAVRDNTKFHHGAQGYLSFPGSEGVLVGKKDASSFSLGDTGALEIDGKHVCAPGLGPLAKTQRACRGTWTLEQDGSVSYSARSAVAFCFAKDKTVFSRNSNRSGCKPVKFVSECIAPKQALSPAPAGAHPLPQQTAPPTNQDVAPGANAPAYGGSGASPAPGGNTPPSYGGGAAAPAPGGNTPPSYGGGAAAPAPGGNTPPSYGGGAAPAPGGNSPPSYGGGSPQYPPGGVPAPGLTTSCTSGLEAQPTQQPPVYGSAGPGPVAPSYGYSPPVYQSSSLQPLPLPGTTTTTCTSSSLSLTDLPTGPTRTTTATTSNSLTDLPTGPTRTTSRTTTTTSNSLTDLPTGPTRTTTTTDMSADPSAGDPTATPSPLRFEALAERMMARGEDETMDEMDAGQRARRHRRARNLNMAYAGW